MKIIAGQDWPTKYFAIRIKKYIGSYAAAMGGLDAVVFTGGIGENSSLVRQNSLDNLSFLGIDLDSAKNNSDQKGERAISSDNSRRGSLCNPYK